MPPAQPSPILRRRRLGTELRKLRESAKLTGDQVIEAVGWASASKLSRLENGRSRPDLRDVLDLLDLYKVTGALREELTAITNEAGDIRSWLRSYATMTPRQRGYAELEAGCAEIREYSPVIVPGLLQTKAYVKLRIVSSRQLVDDPDAEDADTEVAARMARQSLLTREVEPPRYSAVIEEAALGGRAGPRELLRAQLIQLRKLAGLPNVTLQVLLTEQTIASWYLPHTGFSLYRFAEPQDPETLAIEGLATNLMVTEPKEIATYSKVFDWLQDAALGPEETITWLSDMAAQRSSAPRKPASRDPGRPPTQRSRRSGRLTEQ
ncbi:helix-turn-helix transcriptional regulator [Plantactinospora mayteni]|uniref:Transcriptional regulator n=1 Tax=Plantactinospora mayteni TaxID=566021 RepID=A0ABQ4ESI9_9ACTN|nr:helix-turn-helix transcriptional regulator [Plantactinospora mayteni]GIG97628.1 transcriptional regulator [Plantactinospora mayteni]